MFSSKKKTLTELIEEAVKDEQEKNTIANAYTTAIIWCEIDRYHAERQKGIQSVLGQVRSVGATQARRETNGNSRCSADCSGIHSI